MEEKNLGGGIITCSVLNIIIYGFASLGMGILAFARPMIEEVLEQQGQAATLEALSQGAVIITFAIMLLSFVATIIILFKKKIGVFAYFGLVVINIVYGLSTGGGFSIIGLIIPALLAFFIYKKRSVFGFYDPEAEENMDV